MIRILGKLFSHIVRTLMPGPEKANRPILILVEDTEQIEKPEENRYKRGGLLGTGKYHITREEAMKDNPAV